MQTKTLNMSCLMKKNKKTVSHFINSAVVNPQSRFNNRQKLEYCWCYYWGAETKACMWKTTHRLEGTAPAVVLSSLPLALLNRLSDLHYPLDILMNFAVNMNLLLPSINLWPYNFSFPLLPWEYVRLSVHSLPRIPPLWIGFTGQ